MEKRPVPTSMMKIGYDYERDKDYSMEIYLVGVLSGVIISLIVLALRVGFYG